MSVTLLPTQTIALLNTIRNNASTAFQERIPAATQTNLKNWAVGLKDNKADYNEFVDLLVRIGKVIIDSQDYKNELARFKKGELPYGATIQNIWVDIASSEGAFDPTGSNPLGRRLSDVEALYVNVNRKDKYVKSISRPQLLSAFTSADKLGDFIMAQMNAIYSGAEYDEYLCTKELLGNYAPFYENYQVPDIFTTLNVTTLSGLVKTMRKAYKDLQFMSRLHNAQGVMRKSNAGELTLFIRKDVIAEMDVEVLASAFNMSKADFIGKTIEVEDFGTNDFAVGTDYELSPLASSPIVALLVADDCIEIYDQLKDMATILNPDGLFENYFYHIWQCLYMKKYSNAVAFRVDDVRRVKFDISALTGANAIDYAVAEYTVNGTTYSVRVDADKENKVITLPFYCAASSADTNIWKLYTKNGTLKTSGTITATTESSITSIAITSNLLVVTWASSVDTKKGIFDAKFTA